MFSTLFFHPAVAAQWCGVVWSPMFVWVMTARDKDCISPPPSRHTGSQFPPELKPNKLQKFHIHFRPTPDPIRKTISIQKIFVLNYLDWNLHRGHCVLPSSNRKWERDVLSDLNSSFWNSISPHPGQPMAFEKGRLFNSFKFILWGFQTPIRI